MKMEGYAFCIVLPSRSFTLIARTQAEGKLWEDSIKQLFIK